MTRDDKPAAGARGGTDDPSVPLEPPPPLPRRRGRDLLTGLHLLPEQRLAAFAPDQLEFVVAHWLNDAQAPKYARVEVFAGPGDKGRDVVGYPSATENDPWDNFQCKRYKKALQPSDVLEEVGKLVYWTSEGWYKAPRNYTFVAPKGCSPKLRDLLSDHEKLRNALITKWDQYCGGLCGLSAIEIFIRAFDFPDFDVATAERIVNDLRDAAIYPVLFGGGLTKPRPPDKTPPPEIASHELPYVGCLVEAYADDCAGDVATAEHALAHSVYGQHLRESRRDFYCAESLREFSKDVLVEPDDFSSLQDRVFDGVKHTVAQDFPSGYKRVLAVCNQAVAIQVGDHPLTAELAPADRSGICHQLANDRRVTWTKK